MTADELAESTGQLAFRSRKGRVLLHLVRDVDDYRTRCGRYDLERSGDWDPDLVVYPATPECLQCLDPGRISARSAR